MTLYSLHCAYLQLYILYIHPTLLPFLSHAVAVFYLALQDLHCTGSSNFCLSLSMVITHLSRMEQWFILPVIKVPYTGCGK